MPRSAEITEVDSALRQAVQAVNAHAGETCVHVRFSDDPGEIDFIANAARLIDGAFEFRAGIETLAGSVDEVDAIRTEVIGH
jgi:hypothetical protein